MTRFFPVGLLSPLAPPLVAVLAAGLAACCAPQPVYAASYVPCAQAAADANLVIEVVGGLPEKEAIAVIAKISETEYGRVVVSIAKDAAQSGDRRTYLRAWRSACLKLTT